MAIKKKHRLLYLAGAGAAGFAAYKWVYQPWKAQQDAAALAGAGTSAGTSGLLGSLFPSSNLPATLPLPSTMLTDPPYVGPIPSTGIPVGGVVGTCMAKKGWTQDQCSTRLNALVAAAQTAQQAIADLQQGSVNPAAAGIPAAQAALAASQAQLAIATQNYNTQLAAGDTNGASIWRAAILAHQADINDLVARISAASQAPDNSAAIAAYQGQLAANDNDYFALTGVHLLSSI